MAERLPREAVRYRAFYLTPNQRVCMRRKADGNNGAKMELGAKVNAQ
jgi:hypothetical protein